MPFYTISSRSSGVYHAKKSVSFLFAVYIFLSFFEYYLQRFLGPSTKFYMLLLILLLLVQYEGKIRINIYNGFIVLWFLFKLISVTWSSRINPDVENHFLSQIGIVLMMLVLVGRTHNSTMLRYWILATYFCSFLFGVMSILFPGSYIDDRFAARQVLTLWGRQNDPNNNAAFLMVGIALALYSLKTEHTKRWLNVAVIAVNVYATLLTGSRAGFLSIAFVFFIVYFFRSNSKESIAVRLRNLCALVILIGVCLFFVKRYLPGASLDRLLDFSQYEAGSGRSAKWTAALHLFAQHPILGWGWGGYVLPYEVRGGIHNTYLANLCDVGLIGTVLFITPLAYAGCRALKTHSLLALVVLGCGLFPALGLDAINKRFFWNAIFLGIMILQHEKIFKTSLGVWENNT